MTRRRRNQTRGALTVEFAMVAPLVFLFFLAAFEFSRMNMLRHTMEVAAYEGARCGIVPGATAASSRARASKVLAAVATRNPSIKVTPAVIVPSTPEVTVDIRVPLDDNAWVTPNFLRGKLLKCQCTLRRENAKGVRAS